jgi:hypothetical protein
MRPIEVAQDLVLLLGREVHEIGVVCRAGPLVEVAYA